MSYFEEFFGSVWVSLGQFGSVWVNLSLGQFGFGSVWVSLGLGQFEFGSVWVSLSLGIEISLSMYLVIVFCHDSMVCFNCLCEFHSAVLI